MNSEEIYTELDELEKCIRADYENRMAIYPIDLYEPELGEVIAGLLSRQATLAMQLVIAPSTWNQHSAPLFHRSMADVHISLAYILKGEPQKRAKDYILYGLGQEKLAIAHYEALPTKKKDRRIKAMIEARKQWLESQRREMLTEVNVGSATGLNTREMAEQSGNEGLYKFNFAPFSAAVHSTWQHVARFNLEVCSNPLHGAHRVGVIPELENGLYEPWLALKNLKETFELVDGFMKIDPPAITSWERVKDLAKKASQDAQD
jgi:hypothetical protein